MFFSAIYCLLAYVVCFPTYPFFLHFFLTYLLPFSKMTCFMSSGMQNLQCFDAVGWAVERASGL